MNRYKINDEAFEEKGNAGGWNEVKPEQIIKINKRLLLGKERLTNIFKKMNSIKSFHNKYIFFLEYKNIIPPKTKRINFRNILKDLNEVPQKGIKTIFKNKDLYTRLYYEINQKEFEDFREKISQILKLKEVQIETPQEDLVFVKKILEIYDLDVEQPSKYINTIKYVKILPIESIINYLKKKKLLNNNNYYENYNTARLTPRQYEYIVKKFGFIIIDVFSQEFKNEYINIDFYEKNFVLSDKFNSTTIGIIDSGNNLPSEIFGSAIISNQDMRELKQMHDYNHGNYVASLLIAHDELNPSVKDGFGNFKIKHFEVLEPHELNKESIASFSHLEKVIRNVVANNTDIKVWNLSFGGLKSPFSRTISPLGIALDEISKTYDVLFVVASGNERNKISPWYHSLNTPADSLNAISVGSVEKNKDKIKFSDYSSLGPILHFEKPEISSFGGPNNEDGSLLTGFSNGLVTGILGTSFSTPKISRALAYYISTGLTPLEAKAKIISLSVRETPLAKSSSFGYIEYKEPFIELNSEIILINDKPLYLPINFPKNTEKIDLVATNWVSPMPNLGEEYSINNIEIGLIWYDSKAGKNPEHKRKAKMIKSQQTHNNNYQDEKIQRFENGKYFNSDKKMFRYLDIENSKKELIRKNPDINPLNLRLAIRIRKLTLFDTIDNQMCKLAFLICIHGEKIDKIEFEEKNSIIINQEINIEI